MAQALKFEKPELLSIPIERIERGRNPRKYFDEEKLNELTDSIKSQGLLEPIVVERLPEDRYRILAGERRWLACQRAGMTEVLAIVRKVKDQIDALILAVHENDKRVDLTAIDRAEMIRDLKNTGMKDAEIAARMGYTVQYINLHLTLLDVHKDVQQSVIAGKISSTHAMNIAQLPRKEQPAAVKIVIKRQLSVMNTRRLIVKQRKSARSPNVVDLEHRLASRFGCRVKVDQAKRSESTTLSIFCSSYDDLDRAIEIINP